MKRRVISCIIASMMMLAIPGCKNQEAESPASATEANAEPIEEAEPDTEPVEEAEPGIEETDDTESGLPDDNLRYVEVENPSWDYYCAAEEQNEKEAAISLQLISQKANQIIDTEEWFAENGLEQPGFPYSDGIYTYETWGADAYDIYILAIANEETGEITQYDFTEFQYADNYVQEDFAYICQRIIYAQIKDNVLYVATGHSTYAESCPQNAYVTAIDLTTDQVLWKTEPLTCNSDSFVVTDQYLICGYGFTAEPDSLKIVDIGNGKVVSEIPVKSGPDYIILKDRKLFVRTYNTDYVYAVVSEN